MSASGFPSIHVEAYITSVWFAELGDVRMYLRERNQCKKSPLKKLNGSILLDEMSLRLDSYYEFYFQGTLLCTSSELYSYSQLCRETLFMLYCSHWVLFTAGHFTCLSTVSPKNIHIQKKKKRHPAPLKHAGMQQHLSCLHDHHFRFELQGFSFHFNYSLLYVFWPFINTRKKISQKNVTKRQSEPRCKQVTDSLLDTARKLTKSLWGAGLVLAKQRKYQDARNGGWKTGS